MPTSIFNRFITAIETESTPCGSGRVRSWNQSVPSAARLWSVSAGGSSPGNTPDMFLRAKERVNQRGSWIQGRRNIFSGWHPSWAYRLQATFRAYKVYVL